MDLLGPILVSIVTPGYGSITTCCGGMIICSIIIPF